VSKCQIPQRFRRWFRPHFQGSIQESSSLDAALCPRRFHWILSPREPQDLPNTALHTTCKCLQVNSSWLVNTSFYFSTKIVSIWLSSWEVIDYRIISLYEKMTVALLFTKFKGNVTESERSWTYHFLIRRLAWFWAIWPLQWLYSKTYESSTCLYALLRLPIAVLS
jgi:hypothetical protein